MNNLIHKIKPGIGKRGHLFCSAFLWSAIGAFLLFRGAVYLRAGHHVWLALPAVIAGTAKSFFILDRTAGKGVERIRHFSDNTCIGAVYSWKTWVLVMAMMVMGIMIRRASLPPLIPGTVCVAIGWGLFLSSRKAWWAWVKFHTTKRTLR